jgi:hypothetical protein
LPRLRPYWARASAGPSRSSMAIIGNDSAAN